MCRGKGDECWPVDHGEKALAEGWIPGVAWPTFALAFCSAPQAALVVFALPVRAAVAGRASARLMVSLIHPGPEINHGNVCGAPSSPGSQAIAGGAPHMMTSIRRSGDHCSTTRTQQGRGSDYSLCHGPLWKSVAVCCYAHPAALRCRRARSRLHTRSKGC